MIDKIGVLMPGVMHIWPKGSEHSIINTGEDNLVMLTIVVKKQNCNLISAKCWL